MTIAELREKVDAVVCPQSKIAIGGTTCIYCTTEIIRTVLEEAAKVADAEAHIAQCQCCDCGEESASAVAEEIREMMK